MGIDAGRLQIAVDGLHEANPMLGLRGVRLGITYPRNHRMQARAIFPAAIAGVRERSRRAAGDHDPAGGAPMELKRQRELIDRNRGEICSSEPVSGSLSWSAR